MKSKSKYRISVCKVNSSGNVQYTIDQKFGCFWLSISEQLTKEQAESALKEIQLHELTSTNTTTSK